MNFKDLTERFTFLFNRIRERLWVRPLAICLLSIAGVFIAEAADRTGLPFIPLLVTAESLSKLGNTPMRNAAIRHARLSLARAERAMTLQEDLSVLRHLAEFAERESKE